MLYVQFRGAFEKLRVCGFYCAMLRRVAERGDMAPVASLSVCPPVTVWDFSETAEDRAKLSYN